MRKFLFVMLLLFPNIFYAHRYYRQYTQPPTPTPTAISTEYGIVIATDNWDNTVITCDINGYCTDAGHWTRVNFSRIYDDPQVSIPPLSGLYQVGIRNVTNEGFDITLKTCYSAPAQASINYTVVEAVTYKPQRFAWGECL